MYRAVTRKIEVTVTPRFVSERSSPGNGYYFWAYTIDIANLGTETVQLKTRHWRITDAFGYGMVTASGEHFDIDIPAFSLDSSYAERTIN
jgi:ApaG protein